jgi:hypothetical protein
MGERGADAQPSRDREEAARTGGSPAPWMLGSFLLASLALIAGASFQSGEREWQPLFARVPADLAGVLRYRGAYLWADLWKSGWLLYYALLGVIATLAWFRARASLSREFAIVSATLGAYGLLSIPLSWLLWGQLRWSRMSQFQPARAVLLLILCTLILCAAAAWNAAARGRFAESAAWFAPVFLIPAPWFAPTFLNPANLPELGSALFGNGPVPALVTPLVLVTVAVLAILTAGLAARRGRAALAVLAMPVLAALLLLAPPRGARASSQRDDAQVRELAAWAVAHTAPDAMFQFADAGHSTLPGVFRIEARRALYVDWKGGGQVNESWAFAREWQRRWSLMGREEPPPLDAEPYRAAGIDYVALEGAHALAGAPVVFANARWRVYSVKRSEP